jgi:uncharacterized protein (DUF4415 family)
LTHKAGDVRELTREDIRHFKPAEDVLSRGLLAVLPERKQATPRKRGQRGPQKFPTKRQITLRLDPDVVDFYKSTGDGWQTRINLTLRKAMR